MRKKDFKGFYEILKDTIENEEDLLYEDIIKYSPSFFKLLCDILTDKKTDWHTKLVISAALAYFVVPHDIIPEDEYGAMGYVDDVFICAYVLNEIKHKVSEELLIDHWSEEGNILEIVDRIFSESKKVVGDKYIQILQLVGLRRSEDKLPTVSVTGKEREGSKMIERLIHEKEELIGLLAYVTRVLYRAPPRRNIDALKEYLQSQDTAGEIERILHNIRG